MIKLKTKVKLKLAMVVVLLIASLSFYVLPILLGWELSMIIRGLVGGTISITLAITLRKSAYNDKQQLEEIHYG